MKIVRAWIQLRFHGFGSLIEEIKFYMVCE